MNKIVLKIIKTIEKYWKWSYLVYNIYTRFNTETE